MAPKKLQQDPAESQAPPQARNGESPTLDLEALFREAVASGEIDGDTIMVDEQGAEVKDTAPRKTIFDLP